MTDESEDRYRDILKRIAERRPFGRKAGAKPAQTPQDRVLDLINASDSLAELTERDYRGCLCYGPKHVRGAAWSGAVVWYQRKGYHGYQTLTLLGVWAHYLHETIALSIGLRELPYRAPVYDAGVYRVAIRDNFSIYYDDDGRPPLTDDQLLYQEDFKPRDRLAHRQALQGVLDEWRRQRESD